MQAVEFNVSRRRLLGAAAVLGAGATIGSTLSFPTPAVSLAATGRPDLVHAELVRQLEAGVRALRGIEPGEAARSVAATLRLLAAHYQAKGVDADVPKRLRAAIARDGREAVLHWEANLALPREPFDLRARERALTAMLAQGVTLALLDVAAELTRRAPLLDRIGLTPIAARQCSGAQGMTCSIEFIALAVCRLDPMVCVSFTGAYRGLRSSLWYFGC